MKILDVKTTDELLTAIVWNADLDEQKLHELREMPWEDICQYLGLGDALYIAINEEVAKTCLESIIDNELEIINQGRIDRRQEEVDLQLAQGFGGLFKDTSELFDKLSIRI